MSGKYQVLVVAVLVGIVASTWPELEPNCDLMGKWTDAASGEMIHVHQNLPRRVFAEVDHQRGTTKLRGRALVLDYDEKNASYQKKQRVGRILSLVTEPLDPPKQPSSLTLACYNNRVWALEMPRMEGPLKYTRVFSLGRNSTTTHVLSDPKPTMEEESEGPSEKMLLNINLDDPNGH